MSTQLILLPQTYLGVSSGTGSVELLSDGQMFSSLNASAIHIVGSASPLNTLMGANAILFTANTWVRWKTGGGSIWLTPANPQQVLLLQDLELNTVGAVSLKSSGSGVIQKLSNLSVGTSYTIELEVSAPTPPPATSSHSVRIIVYSGSAIIHTHTLATGFHGVVTTAFTAQSANDIITVSNYDNVDADILINYISVKGSTVQPLGVGNGQVICDLYQEEDIPLTLSIDDFKNVTEQVKSYSKDFNLPATKRNNRIFNNMFDVTRADDGVIFNPYVKTACLLKQDGFIIFEGYLRLIDAKDKEGEISYNVNLYSEVIALADVLKDRTFSQLDFSELTHDYTYSNIRNSWQGILDLTNPLPTGTFAGTPGASTTGVLKYPFIDWNHQFSVDSSGNPVLSNLEAAFRPCIKLKYLIQNIFAATDFNYTSEFFDSTEFSRLYMDFNWGSSVTVIEGDGTYEGTPSNDSDTVFKNLMLGGGSAIINFPPEFGYSITNYNFVASYDGTNYTFDYSFPVYMYSSDDLYVRWERRDSGGNVLDVVDAIYWAAASVTAGTYKDYVGNFSITLNQGDTVQPMFKTGVAATGSQGWVSWSYTAYVNATVGAVTVTTEILLERLRGELGQWDFLKGIMTMFNLVSMTDENNPNNILIEPYNDIFVTNPNTKELDWTDKIDVSEMELKPLTDLNKNTIFKFVEDDDDYTFMMYKQSTGGHLYGSKKLDASTSGTTSGQPTTLEGTKEIIAEPFAATVSKQLESQYVDFIVPSIYAVNDDGMSEGFDNSPRIFYENWHSPNGVVDLTSCTYEVPAQNGGGGVGAEDEFLQFSHLSDIPAIISATDKDFVFESAQLFPGVGNPPVNNLFSLYWATYFDELYHADTRTMTLKVNLSPSDIATFKFYDKVFIRNRIFRVNKIEYKPNSLAKVEFILIP